MDWSLKASDGELCRLCTSSLISNECRTDLDLDGVEFSTLPSGLHLVNQDVVSAISTALHKYSA